jgi:hypothetical protein
MANFDVEGARAAGYTDAEIADYLAGEEAFDITGAREAGYTDADIIGHLSAAPAASAAAKPVEEPKSTFIDDAAQLLGVTNRAILPYATAAGLGAAAGGIPTGGLGALPGAGAGILALGVGDIGTSVYNAGADLFGGERMQLPSETIRQGYESVGVGRRPQTPGQEVLFRTAEGAAGGLSGAGAFNQLARTATPGVTRNVMQELGRGIGVQTAAGAGAGAVPAVAREYAGVENPLAQFGLSMAGGMAGGRMATPRATPVTREQLVSQAGADYRRAEQAGVQFDTAAISDLSQSIRRSLSQPNLQFHPRLHPRINVILDDIDEAVTNAQTNGVPISFSQLELLRRVARTAGKSIDKDERRLASGIIRQLDEFVASPPANAVIAGDAADAATAIKNARTSWRRMSQVDALDGIVEKTTNSAEGLSANSLRSAARTIANNPNKMRSFDPDIQKQIKSLTRGSGGLSTLQGLGTFGPTQNLQSIRALPGAAALTGSGAALYSGSPELALLGLTVAGGGLASRAAANKMAVGKVNKMVEQAAGTPTREMFKPQIASQVAQQFGAPENVANANEKTVAIPPEMQSEMNAWFNQNPRGTADLTEYANFRRGLDAKYGFALNNPYEDNPGIKYFVEQYNNPKAAVSLTIPKINTMRR